MIEMIVAHDSANGIGHEGRIQWTLPADLKRFMHLTKGKAVIMGRKTWESLPGYLKDRTNIVIASKKVSRLYGERPDYVVPHLSTAIDVAEHLGATPIIIGGQRVYEEAMPLVSKLYLTRVCAVFLADTYFPQINRTEWEMTSCVSETVAPGITIFYETLERKL